MTRKVIMNSILVINDRIKDFENEFLCVKDNVITFKKNCDYSIYYENCFNINLTINLLDNVYVKLFEYLTYGDIVSNIMYNIEDNANLLLFKFYANLKILENVVVNLNGYMSKIDYHFSNICIGKEKYNVEVNHNDSNSISNINNKLLCLEDGGVIFDINTTAKKGNVKCNMNQDTKIINFKDNHSVIRPNMYISEDDVMARHASVIGSFSDDELFYLMARGIDYNTAIKLLVKGYIFSNLSVDMDKRSKILEIINKYWR